MKETLNFIIPLAFLFFTTKRMQRFLHIFQQEQYDRLRFLGWIFSSFAFDRRLTLCLSPVVATMCFYPRGSIALMLMAAFIAIILFFSYREPDPKQAAKKKLVLTERASRIYLMALIFTSVPTAIAYLLFPPLGIVLFVMAGIQAMPFILLLADVALIRYEAKIQRYFWDEAHAKVMEFKPRIIGVTGSYGKTSVKHMVGHILEINARAIYTAGSVNTPMGIARFVRERLLPDTDYMVIEMGAYGPGSIEKLCHLTPPDIAVVTAIGDAHYERFKTLDTVARAKFELPDAVLAKGDGKVVIHESVLEQGYAREYCEKNRHHFIICGAGDNVDARILSSRQTQQGIDLLLLWQGQEYRIEAPLYGEHHASNLALAFVTAAVAGIEPSRIITSLKSLPQIAHRLEVKPQADGRIIIDDAFNSNPKGFAAALDILSLLGQGGKRRILVTPGMVELGALHDQAHRQLGEKAAKTADIVLAVNARRMRTFAEGFRTAAPNGQLIEVDSFTAANDWLIANRQDGDVILLENDLPDILEKKIVL